MKKLKDFLDKNGIKQTFFAEKLGIRHQQLSLILRGKAKLPKKVWKKVVELTNNEITMNDLLEDFLEDNQE